MAAFLASVIVFALGVGVCALVGRARPIGTPVTWGEAFVAGPFVFALMLLAYGIIPHQWLKYADNDLLWRSDKIFVGLSMWHLKTGKAATHMAGAGRILINFQALRDVIAALIYIVMLGFQVLVWSKWQKRGQAKPELEPTSKFGRPVIREV